MRDQVIALLNERFDISPETISDESDLRADLDLDSIDLFDMMGVIEKQSNVCVEMSDFIHAKTFGDLVRILERITHPDSIERS